MIESQPSVQAPLSEGEIAAWVGFDLVSGIGPARFSRLRERYGDLANAWSAPASELRSVLDERALAKLHEVRSSGAAERMWQRLAETSVRAVTLIDSEYPALLAEIPAPPPVLYVRGVLLPEDRVAVAIVGTRRMTSYGREMAERIAQGLAQAGVTVVSGLALGIDGVAHRAAVEAGGRTIAVMGCGVNVPYPASHRQLAEQIAGQGALLSDYPPDRKPDAANFPARNRIISGLTLGTVVIEAPERSGALITVNFAADQGRDVFIVPGSVLSQASAGCHRLLRDGARLVRSADDILEDLQLSPSVGREERAALQTELPLDDDERRVLAILGPDPQHIDEIATAANRPIREIASQLTMLELKGLVRNTGAQHYGRVGSR